MPEPYRIGVLGLTHDHVWGNLQDLHASDEGVLVAAADPNGPLLEQVQQQFGCTTYNEYDALLEREQLDAVYIFSDNAAGAGLTEKAAAKGLHVMIEKPMAADVAGADRMLAAARRAGVRLMVNWPFAWWPQMQKALAMAAGGDIGDVWQVKYRAAHAGPKELGCSTYFCDWLFDAARNGGGALIDYGCYGALLARRLLGVPSRVTAVAGRVVKEDITVEDNAVIVMSYANAIAISEGSWSQIGNLTSYVTAIHGTQGTLLIEPRVGGRLLLATDEHPDGAEVEVPPALPHFRNATAHFLHCLRSGSEFFTLCNDRVGRDAQEILTAGLISAREGRHVSLPLSI
jgi:predicted dehydrogenase